MMIILLQVREPEKRGVGDQECPLLGGADEARHSRGPAQRDEPGPFILYYVIV